MFGKTIIASKSGCSIFNAGTMTPSIVMYKADMSRALPQTINIGKKNKTKN